MEATTSAPRGRHGFERRGWWPAIGVLAVVLAVWAIPAITNDAVAEPTASAVDPSARYRLVGTDSGSARVTPDPAWHTSTGTSGEELTFEAGTVTMTASIFTDVEDIDRFWERQARALEAGSPPEHAYLDGEYVTARGLAGPTGTTAGNRERGELFLLADRQAPRTVLRFEISGPPGALAEPADAFDRFLDSAEVTP